MRLYVFACSAPVDISVKLPTDFNSSKIKVIILYFWPRSTTLLLLSLVQQLGGQTRCVRCKDLCAISAATPEQALPITTRDIVLKALHALSHHVLILAAKWYRTATRGDSLNLNSARSPSCCLLLYAHSRVFPKCHSSIWGRMQKKNFMFSFLITVSGDVIPV